MYSFHFCTLCVLENGGVSECYTGTRTNCPSLGTRMHSSRMRTARSLIVSPYLIVSHAHPPLGATLQAPREQPHTPQEQPCTPPQEQPCTPPWEQPCTPPRATMHTPRATMHPSWSNHAGPPGSNHTHPLLWMELMTHASEYITLPQLRCGR